MKKELFFVIAGFLLALNTYAQKEMDDNLFSVSFGPSIPIGNYGNTNLANDNAGFAKTGEAIHVSFEHKLNKHFGIAAMLYRQKNSVNTAAMSTQFEGVGFNNTPPYFSNGSTPPPTPTYVYVPNWQFDKDSYYLGGFYAGGVFESPIGKAKRLSFVAKAMLGVVNATSPELNGKGNSDTVLVYVNQTKATAWGCSYLLSAGLKYRLHNKWNLMFNTEYVGTNSIKFKNVTTSYTLENGYILTSGGYVPGSSSYLTTSSKLGAVTQTFQSINLNLGIGWSF